MEQFQYQTLGKILLIVGGILVLLGVIFLFAGKLPFVGKLPGDITVKGKGYTVYFPIVTFLVLSILLTIILNIFFRK
jgi:hypothetical protein